MKMAFILPVLLLVSCSTQTAFNRKLSDIPVKLVKEKFEVLCPLGPQIKGIQPAFVVPATQMSDTEVQQFISMKEAEIRLAYEKELNQAKLDAKKDRLESENKLRISALVCVGIGFALIIAGVVCAIWASKKTGIKAVIAGIVVGGLFGAIVVYTQWYVLIFAISGILAIPALVIWLIKSGRADAVINSAIASSEVMKNANDWQTNKKARAAVRVLQGAEPEQKTMSWIETFIAEKREKLRKSALKCAAKLTGEAKK
jgi:hypothetical protein